MTKIAVVAHQGNSLGGALKELRRVLSDRGFPDPLWYEAPSSRKLAPLAIKAVARGAEPIFLWGGDGTIQRCVNVIAGEAVTLAILPAGSANLLATNPGIPNDLEAAVDVGLNGDQRRLDVGVLNGTRFIFPEAQPDDGLLEIGVVTAENAKEWLRVLARIVVGQAENSPVAQLTQGRRVGIQLSRRTVYELDGGARNAKKRLRATIEPGAIEVRVPRAVRQ